VNRIVRQGSLGRNTLRNLPIYQADVALSRTFKLRESLNLKLKGEAFNVFNHPMFAMVDQLDTDPTFSNFGVPHFTVGGTIGGLSSLHQLGGPRSIQLSARIEF
jgi:hypothetical protein